MKSVCVKTNNNQIINYLLKEFENILLDETYISFNSFSHFQNIIIHHKNKNYSLFINKISNLLTKCVLNFYEKKIISDSINLNYFYFNGQEKNNILYNTLNLVNNSENYTTKFDLINNKIFEYLTNEHSLYITGFINFRLNTYHEYLNEKIDFVVNKFLIDKEYLEFVNILRLYINSESVKSTTTHLHLIYTNSNSIIINDNKEIISCNDNISKAKYISDISFSSNDLALNTLLNLLPQKITIHLTDNNVDEFINTLKLIFQDRIVICVDCDICNIYKCKNIITNRNAIRYLVCYFLKKFYIYFYL